MQNVRKTFVASASELMSSDLFMTIKTVMLTSPTPNLNGVSCSEAFLDEIVENQDKYVTLPLCADVKNLVQGHYDKLGHCYDAKKDEFHSTDIGSFCKFEKAELEGGEQALIGYARIQKRKKAVCKALSELFLNNALKVSFEIVCGSAQEMEDGTILIDRADNNYLEGMCVVSFPACPEAVAQQLVAEITQPCETKEEMSDMDKEQMKLQAEEQELQAEQASTETTVETAEEASVEETAEEKAEAEDTVDAEKKKETCGEEQEAEEKIQAEADSENYENAEEASAEKETAEVVTTERTFERQSVETYDTETRESSYEEVTHETVNTVVDNGQNGFMFTVAEEQTANELSEQVKQLREELAELRQALAEFKEAQKSSVVLQASAVNPFMADITTPNNYSLLEKADTVGRYSLLDPA